MSISPTCDFCKKELKDFKETFNLGITNNSLDVVSDRDFVVEVISALSITCSPRKYPN